MPGQYCFLCASDEGIFLDVTPDNRASFNGQLETCLSTKVNKLIDLSNKICYKCAYELELCSKFIQKCKKSHKDLEHPSAKKPTLYCCLCFEYVESSHFFDITKDNHTIFNPLQKIRNIFNEDLTKRDSNSKLICLTCRYSLDVLYDLKKLYHETVINLKALINQEIDYSTFPKVYTDVVNRKTTISTFRDDTVFMLLSSDSDTNETMARKKTRGRKRKATKQFNIAKSKNRTCDECCNSVADGHDMYRFHRTGLTVCKSCWITMDPSKGKAIRRTQNNSTETKLCAVFLKDVLSEGSYKNEKAYKLGSDKDGNKLFVISDDTSQDEDRSQSVSPKIKSSIINGGVRRGRKRRIDATKSNDETSTLSELRGKRKYVKKMRLSKASSDTEQLSTNSLKQRERKTRGICNSDRNSDPDVLQLALRITSELGNRIKRRRSSGSDAEDTKKKSRKRSKSASGEIPMDIHSEPSDESSSNESSPNLRKRRTRKSPNASAASTSRMETENKRETRSRTRSSSISSKEMTPPVEFKSPKFIAPSEVKIEYSCDKCNKKFDSKLLNAEHKLTHLKQATLQLERINISSDEQKQTKTATEEDEILKETEAHFDKNMPIEKQADDPSEEIAINIEDDTDDEEIFCLSRNKNARQLVKKEQHNEDNDDNVNVMPNAIESKSHLKEESTKIQNNEKTIMKEFQQCENAMVVPDETVIPSEEKENENTKDKDAETLTNKNTDTSKNNGSQEVIVTTVENDADLNVKRNEAAEEENDIEITENESVVECENDKQDINNEITPDNKTTELSAPTITKRNNDNTTESDKGHDKSLMNDLENTCKDNENETIEDVEFCDTINESQTKDTKESEEKEHTTDIVNDLGVLKDTKATDDAIANDTKVTDDTIANDTKITDDAIANDTKVENLEKYQNGINKQNKDIEATIDVDKSSSSGDSIKSDISNCKEVDKMNMTQKDDTDRDDITVLIDDDNDAVSVESKQVTEKTVTINDSAEKRKLAADKNDFEQLLENDVVMAKCEVQESLICFSSDNSPMNTANEILKEVFDLAAAEAQKREEINNTKNLSDDTEMETLENISREIRNSADMPSLDPISVMEEDDDNDIRLI